MKKYLLLAFSLTMILALLVSTVVSAEGNDLLSQIKERGYIVIATEGDWAPWTYHNEENQLVGLDVEIG
ncbi:MAG: amino acid ABC transporter substrate-binding protein, partial [Clostridia bacterium]|nr:amino acid ABC transporter substrate-binding protein [Clostridia bacterium]